MGDPALCVEEVQGIGQGGRTKLKEVKTLYYFLIILVALVFIMTSKKTYTNENASSMIIPQIFYGTWEVTDETYLAGQTPQNYTGRTVSFSEEENISFQAQMLLKDDEYYLLVYFRFADEEKQRINPFSAFVVKSADEIVFITDIDVSCSAKKISDEEGRSGQNKHSMSVEDMLKSDMENRKCCNESYLYRTIVKKWQVENDALSKGDDDEELLLRGELEIYSDENSLSEKEINESREFPDLKSHNIYWGIMCLPEDGRLFGKTPDLRKLGVESDVILYGMSKDNSWNEDCVFIAINQEEMLLVKENSVYRIVCKNPDTEYVRYDKLFRAIMVRGKLLSCLDRGMKLLRELLYQKRQGHYQAWNILCQNRMTAIWCAA